jgi:hypothetical protein
MSVPIQPVTNFAEAELWYMYQQLVEINANTLSGSLNQTELYEVFNGTNPQGLASSLFESLSGGDTPLANLFVDTLSGFTYSVANLNFLQLQSLSSIDGNCASIQSNTLNNQIYTLSCANSLTSIDTKLSSQSTAANQTTANSSLSSIDTKLTTETTNTTNISTYLSTVRTPVVISTSASATISGQLHNISIYNSGAAVGTITVNGTTINLPVGVTVNYDAGGNNNRFPTNSFGYNATGTTFIISYVI